MKKRTRRWTILLCIAMLLLTLAACGETSETTEETTETTTDAQTEETTEQETLETAEASLTDASAIVLADGATQADASGVTVDGDVITITAGGTYQISGTLTDGRILVDAKGENVVLALDGASITCSYGSPIYIYKAETATVYLVDGTESTLADGTEYTYDDDYSDASEEEPNACLYSKADLVIQGTGSLTVEANYQNGITGKDTLLIQDATLTVTAVKNGINGKDSNTITAATLTVTATEDVLRSTNDTDETLGWISITDSVLTLEAGEDAVQAETQLTITDCTVTATSGGGSAVTPDENTSSKGLKAGGTITLNGGTYVLDSSDDAVHGGGDVTVESGTYTVSSGDDAFHSDETMLVNGGTIDILTAYEGLEGSDVTVNDGEITMVTSDDGINAAGGADASGFGGFAMGGMFGSGAGDYTITIAGGTLTITAGGDGVDSNGDLVISGGLLAVCSSGNDDGALDYESSCSLEGGTVFAASAGNMLELPSDPDQYTLYFSFDSTVESGSYVQIASETQEFVYQLTTSAANVVFTSPELAEGETYTISYGGTYEDGVYSGGTVLSEMTITDSLTTYGQLGGMGGGFGGGMGGGRGGDQQQNADGEMPDMSEMPTDGEMPDMSDMPTGDEMPSGDMGGGRGGENGGEQPTDPGQSTDADTGDTEA